ncbi:MAG: 5-formyltetrahydrofolate cyclo-ligase [Oceanidesulfovibrio sp.]
MTSRGFGTSSLLSAHGSALADKDELRRIHRAMRDALPPEQAEAMSRLAQERVMDMQTWREAEAVLLYVGCRGETATTLLLRAAWDHGKSVLLPRCLPASPGEMELACARSERDLKPGLYAIPEPDPAVCLTVESPRVDLVVVPGLAFDRNGYRLGQGGGYYDRLLASEPFAQTLAVGLAYDFQVVDDLPVDRWDRRVTAVASDKELIWT